VQALGEPTQSNGASRTQSGPARAAPAQSTRTSAALGDLLVVALIAAGWWVWLTEPVRRLAPVADDTFRDTAYVHNILHGRLLQDPSVNDLSWWYAPLGPLFYAAVCRVTGADPLAAYSSSILWINVWILGAIYIVVRLYWDRGTALLAMMLVWLGSRWWQTHLAMPMPSIQGILPVMACLALWWKSVRCGRGWAVALGVALAVCAWHHIPSALIVGTSIGGNALLWSWSLLRRRRCVATDGASQAEPALPAAGREWNAVKSESHLTLRRFGLAAAIAAGLVLPLVWHLVRLPWNNPAHAGVADEMMKPAFALHADTPLMLPLALAGLIAVLRGPRGPGDWVLTYLAAGLIGQSVAYGRECLKMSLPVLLPHEFQWHAQLAIAVLAAIGIMGLARAISRRRLGLPSTWVKAAAAIVLIAMIVAPDRLRAMDRIDDYWVRTRGNPEVEAVANWIQRNANITDVFVCRYLPGYYEIAGRTGRKLILPPEARANPALDVQQRRRDLHRLETTHDAQEFLVIATGRYGARYVYVPPDKEYLLPRWMAWGVFETVYRSPNGSRVILEVPPEQIMSGRTE